MVRCQYCKTTIVVLNVGLNNDGRKVYWVECSNCGARGPQNESKDLAKRLWSCRGDLPENIKAKIILSIANDDVKGATKVLHDALPMLNEECLNDLVMGTYYEFLTDLKQKSIS